MHSWPTSEFSNEKLKALFYICLTENILSHVKVERLGSISGYFQELEPLIWNDIAAIDFPSWNYVLFIFGLDRTGTLLPESFCQLEVSFQ